MVNGVKIECYEDGSVYLPKSGANEAHRTFGSKNGNDPVKGGYLVVKIRNRSYKVHRLICEAFHENPNGYPEVDHIDRNRRNNRPENLRWASRQDNNRNTSSNDRSKARYGINSFEDRKEYRLRQSREYESTHLRIDIINEKGGRSRVICSREEHDILTPLKKILRREKLKELRNGH